MSRAWVTASLLLTIELIGCKSAPTCPLYTQIDADKALSDHETRRSRWQSIKAEARVTQSSSNGRIRGTVLMFLEQPNRVRFDVMTALGPAAVLTSDGTDFQLSDLREGTFLHGPTCPQNIARLLGVSVEPEHMLLVLTGDTPLIDAVEQSVRCHEGLYVVTLVAADGTVQEAAFSVHEEDRDKAPQQQRLRLRRSTERAPDGEKRWEATYDDYFEVDGQSFPTNIRFVDHLHDAETAVRVRSISVDPDIPDGAFEQVPSPGMSIEFASCS